MTKIKVGVVGLGEVAQVIHLPILQAHADQFEIAAICDISQELLSALGERYNVPVERRYIDYTDIADMLAFTTSRRALSSMATKVPSI